MNAITKMKLADIDESYNPENDVPKGIQVTWVDYSLLRALREAFERIEQLEQQIDRLTDEIKEVRS